MKIQPPAAFTELPKIPFQFRTRWHTLGFFADGYGVVGPVLREIHKGPYDLRKAFDELVTRVQDATPCCERV